MAQHKSGDARSGEETQTGRKTMSPTDNNWPTIEDWWGTPDELDEHIRGLIDEYTNRTGRDGTDEGCQAFVNDWFWHARQEVKRSTFTQWLKRIPPGRG